MKTQHTLAQRTQAPDSTAVRERILATASELFYKRGVRAVGIDLVIEQAGVAKTSLYRYFPSKDDLIVAFLEREDIDFWSVWDGAGQAHANDPMEELEAHMRWIGERLSRSNYRGCPQINVAAEFAEHEHPARQVARSHMQGLRRRLAAITGRLDVTYPDKLAAQLAVLVNGAFVSSDVLVTDDPTDILLVSLRAMVNSASKQASTPSALEGARFTR